MANLAIRVKNPPAGANRWGFTVLDWTGVKSQSVTVTDISGTASFNIPPDWQLPFRFWISIIQYDGGTTILHQRQSQSSGWPDYVDVFIPSLGAFAYDVNTVSFEPVVASAAIVEKKVIYDGAGVEIPAEVPLNTTGMVSIKMESYEDSPTIYGLYVLVEDPGGGVRKESNLVSPPVSKNGIHYFEIADILFDQLGDWVVTIQLYWQAGDGVWGLIEEYAGALCTVVEAVPAEFSNLVVTYGRL